MVSSWVWAGHTFGPTPHTSLRCEGRNIGPFVLHKQVGTESSKNVKVPTSIRSINLDIVRSILDWNSVVLLKDSNTDAHVDTIMHLSFQ